MAFDERVVLGLDIGVASVGWALIRFRDSEPVGLAAVGVRRFETGTDGGNAGEGGISQGRDQSRAKSRRAARGMRRQIDRRSQRIANTLRHLQSGNLLPAQPVNRGDGRHDYICSLDRTLIPLMVDRLITEGMTPMKAGQEVAIKFPYLLRARALTEKLSEHELGRALLHLAQRRGFKSNRKEEARMRLAEREDNKKKKPAKEKPGEENADDPRQTLQQIQSLRDRMQEYPTLGAFLAGLNPHETRIRALRTSRDMFESEFKEIIAKQAPYHAILKDETFLRRLKHALFFQRSLRSARALRSRCEFFPKRRCVARATLLFQRYRMVTEVNNLIDGGIIEPTGVFRKFEEAEKQAIRHKLYAELERLPKLTLKEAMAVLLDAEIVPKKSRWGYEKNEDFAKGKRLPGLNLVIELANAAPDGWPHVALENREKLVSLLRGAENSGKLIQTLAADPWHFSADEATAVAEIPFEEGYGAYSRGAIEKLLPLLEKGLTLPTAIEEAFGQGKPIAAVDRLPGLKDCFGDIRNPAVTRSLTEMRKVVNRIVKRFGKPDQIRVELARDLKRGRKERQAIFKANEKRRADAEKADDEARHDLPSLPPGRLSRRDRIKWQLAQECQWHCPYSPEGADGFEPHDLLNGRVEVEHIIPRSQYGRDDISNLTLCINTENATKGGKTPRQAYGHDSERWQSILKKVRAFRGPMAASKLELFQMADEDVADEAFAMRHLNDTRYATKLAVRYLGRLYGFVENPTKTEAVDLSGVTRVQSNTGGLTDLLRRKWELMRVMDALLRGHPGAEPLPPTLSAEQREEINKRGDHRHHAMDAIIVAMTTPRLIQQLANIAREAEQRRLPFDRLPPIPDPWAGFTEDVENALMRIVVSQRPDRRINQALHRETNYSRPIKGKDGQLRAHHRVFINEARPADIADDAVRAAVEARLNGGKPDKTFVLDKTETLPVVGQGTGAHAVKRVRVIENAKPRPIGAGYGKRYVVGGSNDHMVIYRKPDGKTDWAVCSTLDAMGRLRNSEEIVQAPPGCELIEELRKGDYFKLWDNRGNVGLYVLDDISADELQFRLPHLLRDPKHRHFGFGRPRIRSPKAWLETKPQKMAVNPLGEVSDPTGSVAHG